MRHLHDEVHLLFMHEHLTSFKINSGAHGRSHVTGFRMPSLVIRPWPTADGILGCLSLSFSHTIA